MPRGCLRLLVFLALFCLAISLSCWGHGNSYRGEACIESENSSCNSAISFFESKATIHYYKADLNQSHRRRFFVYIPVLNELGLLEKIVREAQLAASATESSRFAFDFLILDNTGCAFAQRGNHNGKTALRSSSEGEEEGGHNGPRFDRLRESLLHGERLDCPAVQDRLSQLTEQHPPQSKGEVSVQIIRHSFVTLSFSQSMNFVLRHAQAAGQDYVLFAHSDMSVLDRRIFPLLVGFIGDRRRDRQLLPTSLSVLNAFCFAFTNYDALAVVDVRAVNRLVGDFDERLSYYGDTDFFLRCELAGLPAHHLPFETYVGHKSMASIANGPRYGRAVMRSVPSWRAYYESKWRDELHLPTDTTNCTFVSLSWTPPAAMEAPISSAGVKTRAACPGRRRVDLLLQQLVLLTKPPRRVFVRHVQWDLSASDDLGEDRLVIVGLRLYMLPQAVMDDWAGSVDWGRVVAALCAQAVDIHQALFRVP
jgi:hypothetical protein